MDGLIAGASDAVSARYLVVATVAFQAYDYLISLDDEIQLVWTNNLDLRHVHFFLNRYVPFTTSLLSLYYVVLNDDLKGCSTGFGSLVFMTVIGMLIAEFTVFLRVDAVWGHKRIVRILIATLYLHVKMNSVLPIYFMSGCLYFHDDRKVWIALLCYSLCEFVALALLLSKTLMGSRYTSSPIMHNLHQDGMEPE
ncbi:uncharacterized protein FOMMEDRAFT_160348 [Fomitiporia mediterranea MF3/22]|uniref:uncharacterized protein n=1 Tax=Fomitiporia mediterranea (strain MF3/22) TaxID=694068 RepID=UPI0004409111|nr:uncharacterized protein FOMMEDRAFT_160348 [Fomitiporia mediterranea MF3/22]EJC99892.1 hypothetical protein FOMMEDRAFT_160348 [Fomitiporia mediterranea MF3/22]